LTEIAKRAKNTRDVTFTRKNAKGQMVNRTTAMASKTYKLVRFNEGW
jgi:hypothetical protein